MRARSRDVGRYEGARFGVAQGLVGIGEPLSRIPHDIDEALFIITNEFGQKSARMLERFAELHDETLVWTQTGDDEYRLGQICGPWHYECLETIDLTGVCQVRPTDWLTERFDQVTAPAAVTKAFSRGGRNFQRIGDSDAGAFSGEVVNLLVESSGAG